MKQWLAVLTLVSCASMAQAMGTYGYLGGGLGYPLKPQAYADTRQSSWQAAVGGGYYLGDIVGIGADAGLADFPLRTDRLNLPSGYTVSGGDDGLIYYDVQLRLQSRDRVGAGGFAYAGVGLLQESTAAFDVSFNGTKVGSVDAATYDPAWIGVFGAGLHFGNFGVLSIYTDLKLITTRDNSDAARLTLWSLGLMY